MSFSKPPSLKIKALIGLVVLLILGGVLMFLSPPIGYNNGYEPLQPIPYDHSLHAGKYQIPCQYCHSNVDKSKHATIPSLNVCMNCHNSIKADSPHIQKLKKIYEAGGRMEWNKVHMLPDFVHFNHKRHVARGVACQTCHGQIQEMQVVRQNADLSMGWCVNCHRKPEYNAPTNCSTCHY